MTSRDTLAKIVERLPDDKVGLAIKKLEPLLETSKNAPSETLEAEATEFVVRPLPGGPIRLPFRDRQASDHVGMDIADPSAKHLEAMRALTANLAWWGTHRHELLRKHRNVYIAISKAEVVEGESYSEAYARARARQPDDTPFVFYLFDIQAS